MAAAPITVVDLEAGAEGDRGTAAAPTAGDVRDNGLLISAPLAAAPMTNLLSGSGASGKVVPDEPITI